MGLVRRAGGRVVVRVLDAVRARVVVPADVDGEADGFLVTEVAAPHQSLVARGDGVPGPHLLHILATHLHAGVVEDPVLLVLRVRRAWLRGAAPAGAPDDARLRT